jgi:hypothetical protein
MATITLAVTVSNPGSGNKYYIDGVLQATVSMTPGNTYKFDQADNSNSGHPLRLSTTSNGSHNSGSEYTTGVTTSGTPGSSGAYTQIEVTALTVQTLYYYCTAHSGMGGTINVGNSSTKNLKEMSGFAVENLSSDPVPYAQALSNDPYGGVWSSGGTLNTARYRMIGGMGTQTAGYVVGGATPNKANVESYNGTAWTETTDVPTATADNATMGTATAGASIGGAPYLNTMEIWNGSAWAEGGNLPTGKTRMTAAGTTTAALAVGGAPPPGSYANTSLEYDGSSWTAGGTLPAVRGNGGQSGTQTAGFVFGGYSPSSASTLSLTYDGSSFSATPGSLNNAYSESGFSVSGTQSSSWISGGTSPSTGKTEYYDGTSWTASGDMAQKRSAGGSLGTGTLGLYAGGSEPTLSPTTTGVTEEFGFSGLPPATPAADYSDAIVGQMYYNSTTGQFKAVNTGGAPLGTWASGANMPLARDSHAGFGTKTAAGAVGGRTTPGPAPALTTSVNTFISYDGTSWTEGANINQQRWLGEASGTLTSAILYTGGNPGSNNTITNVETWNGSSWTETTDVNTARRSLGGAGISSTAALAYGGRDTSGSPTPPVANTETWNGSSWTEGNDLNTARAYNTGSGTTTTAIYAGGHTGSGSSALTEIYDGTSWTEVNDLNTGRHSIATSGDSAGALAFAGAVAPSATGTKVLTEAWDGTSWTEVADLANARYDHNAGGSPGSTFSAIATGGYAPSPGFLNATEEWTAADFEIKTLTTS